MTYAVDLLSSASGKIIINIIKRRTNCLESTISVTMFISMTQHISRETSGARGGTREGGLLRKATYTNLSR